MNSLQIFTLIFLMIFLLFSCSKCDEQEINIHQIGEWEGVKIAYRLSNEMDTLSIDTTNLTLQLNEDFTGMYNAEKIVKWEKKHNSFVEKDKIRLDLENGTLISSFVHIDELNYQEWESHVQFFGTLEVLGVYYKLNRR